MVNNDVNGILEDSNGNLWFATNNGLSFWNVTTNHWKSFYHNEKEHAQVFHDLCEDNQGRIWCGTYSSGVYLIDSKSGNELNHYSYETSRGQFNDNFVFDIYKDSLDNIWIGGVNGDLKCYLSSEHQFRTFKNYTVKVMKELRQNQLLFGSTFGLLLMDMKTGKTQRLVQGYLVNDILIKNEEVWICTGGNGVVRYNINNKKVRIFSVDSGLPSNYVNSITYSSGYLWIGTEHGLCRMKTNGDSIVTYDSPSLLSNVSFNPKSFYNLKNGKLIWGTNKGVLIFDPRVLQANNPKGRIFYQDLYISGRSIRESTKPKLKGILDNLKELSLQYYQNTISLELIPIGGSSSGTKFSWKLNGLDKKWSKPLNNRILTYTNLPSGNYSLMIRMYDSSLATVVDERTILIHVIPPFWGRWWFKLLLFVFIIGLLLLIFSFYIDRLNKQHSEEKIRFFANTAHDIRTSLTLIKGPVEELNKEPALSDKGLHYLYLATEQTQRLLSVVTQLMDFQKVDIGKEKPNLAMIDIVKTLRDRVMMFESYAMSKNIELQFETNSLKYITAVDETKIEKIIDNLVSNAIKYSFPNNKVEIHLHGYPNKWILEVKDQGIGISKKAQRQLFHEYYRGENVVNSKIVGSGIGLLLVKNYVMLHGGKVNCTSQLNIGSVFQVTIPFKKIEEFINDQKEIMKPQQTLIRSKEIQSEFLNPDHFSGKHKMKVLIVEDHDYLREFLMSAMESEFHIFLAEDGQQGWEVIQKEAPDLVVSDILMPGMDGFELCTKVKSTYETSHIPIILLTALTGKAQQLKGLGLGADDYLIKPFDVTLLQQRIKSIIQNRQIIREKALKIIKIEDEETVLLDNELNDKFLKRLIEVARENLANGNFSKDDFASAMNVSRSLLYRKVKSLTDQSPSDFIKSVRLEYALELLKLKKHTITEISELCGFSSVSYFSNVFRKYYGKSPTQIA